MLSFGIVLLTTFSSLYTPSRMLESYSQAFHTLKPSQRLTLFPTVGTVEIEMELEDRTFLLEVEPILAAIIHLFEDHGRTHGRQSRIRQENNGGYRVLNPEY